MQTLRRLALAALLLAPTHAFAQSKESAAPSKESAGFSGGTVTAPILFSPDNSIDLGSASFRVRTGYFGTSLVFGSAGTKASGGSVDGDLLITNNAGTAGTIIRPISTSSVGLRQTGGGLAGAHVSSLNIGESGARTSAFGAGAFLPSNGHVSFYSATAIDSGSADSGVDRLSAGVVQITNGSTGTGKLLYAAATATIAADDTTPSVASGLTFVTSANTGATAITDLDDPTVGQVVRICGGSDTNSSTIADSGNFNIAGAFTASLDDCITLCVQADNDYVECAARTNN